MPDDALPRHAEDYAPETPKPGQRLNRGEEDSLYARFLRRWKRVEPLGVPTFLPTNEKFPSPVRVHMRMLSHERLSDELPVFFMVEFPPNIFETRMADVRGYLASKHPWEDYDFYIFDHTVDWCISITHNEQCVLVDEVDYFDTRGYVLSRS